MFCDSRYRHQECEREKYVILISNINYHYFLMSMSPHIHYLVHFFLSFPSLLLMFPLYLSGILHFCLKNLRCISTDCCQFKHISLSLLFFHMFRDFICSRGIFAIRAKRRHSDTGVYNWEFFAKRVLSQMEKEWKWCNWLLWFWSQNQWRDIFSSQYPEHQEHRLGQ